jgi:hypothetical protein
MRITLVLALIAACSPWVSAQRMVSAPHFGPPRSGNGFHGNGEFGHRNAYAYPAGFLSYPFSEQALFDSGYPVAAQAPVIVLQSPPAQAVAPAAAQAPMQPLMIELQGDRYVRLSGEDDSRSEMVGGGIAESAVGPNHAAHKQPLPALLIFRDGHQEQAAEYTIADGILYAHRDFYSDGTWTRKIGLSALNLPETIRANQSQGVRFQLPAASNEVIVGP